MISALIVAGGSGLRMGNSVRKQYLAIGDLPVLVRTLMVFDHCEIIDRICLVVPEEDREYCQEMIVKTAELKKPLVLVSGGEERQQSVYEGIKALENDPDDYVVIHDGVRPFISCSQITECVDAAVENGAAILAVPSIDTLKQASASGEVEKTIDRGKIWQAQTPQVFRYEIIRRAHDLAFDNMLSGTDDASLVESIGGTVRLVEGSRRNIKITTPEDLVIAEALVDQ